MIDHMEIRFDKYCQTCKYADREERLDPCNDCLAVGSRENSEKPLYYEEKERK